MALYLEPPCRPGSDGIDRLGDRALGPAFGRIFRTQAVLGEQLKERKYVSDSGHSGLLRHCSIEFSGGRLLEFARQAEDCFQSKPTAGAAEG